MGVYYSARTIIGYRVTDARRYDCELVPNCGHNPPEDATFCPQCGAKVGTHTERRHRQNWDDFSEAMQVKLPAGLKYEEDFEYNDAFWIGYGSMGMPCGEQSKLELRDPAGIRSDIRTLLDPYLQIGLFTLNEDDFGIWTLHIGR